MQLTLDHDIHPRNVAIGAIAAIATLINQADEYNLPADLRLDDWRKLDNAQIGKIIRWLWSGQTSAYAGQIIRYVQNARTALRELTTDLHKS